MVILGSHFERLQIIPGAKHGNIQVGCVDCSLQGGQVGLIDWISGQALLSMCDAMAQPVFFGLSASFNHLALNVLGYMILNGKIIVLCVGGVYTFSQNNK